MLSRDQQRAFKAIVDHRLTCFVTGEAGSGKSYLINEATAALESRGTTVYRAASTGIAASHIDGVTGFRLFGIIPTEKGQVLALKCKRRARPGDDVVFVIDEMSMLRVDVLDAIDERLRMWGDPTEPWGGFQVVMVGDWEQLPPVVRGDEVDRIRAITEGGHQGYAFQHPQWPSVRSIVLTTVHRQADDQKTFKRILNDVRNGVVTDRSLEWMNRRFKRGPAPPNVIRLCNTRAQMERCNKFLLPKGSMEVTFDAEITGSYRADLRAKRLSDLPLPPSVTLRVGSRVMVKTNIKGTKIVNGDLGTLVDVDEEVATVDLDRHGMHQFTRVLLQRVESMEPGVDAEGEPTLVPKISGSMNQIPLIPAHAITIHSSQGLSLDAAEISMDPNSRFSPAGLMYVALSRVRSLDGVYISYPLERWMFKRSEVVAEESSRIAGKPR